MIKNLTLKYNLMAKVNTYTDTQGRPITQTAYESQKNAWVDVSWYKPILQDTTTPKVITPAVKANLTDPMALENGQTPAKTVETPIVPQEEVKPATPEVKVDTTTTTPEKQVVLEPSFSDNSDKRLKDIQNNLKNYDKTNPELFNDRNAFNLAFSYDKRSNEQKSVLDTYFKSRQNLIDQKTSESNIQHNNQKLLNNLSIMTPEQLLTRGLSDDEKILLQQWNPDLYNQYVTKQSEKQKLAMINGTDKKETTNPFQAVIDNYMKNLQNFSTNSNLYTEYKKQINDESLKAEKNTIIDLQNQVDALNTQIQWVEDDVKSRYEWTGATSGKIARIVADEQKALYKKMQLLNDQLTSASNVYTNKINTINDEFNLKQQEEDSNMKQRNQQMSELWFAMNLMSYQTPEQQDERERNKFIRQEEYTNWNIYSSDPATRRKAVEKAVDNVLKEFDWIPMQRSREQMIQDIQNMVDNWEELGTAITKNIREPIKNKPEYKVRAANKLGVSESALQLGWMNFWFDANNNLTLKTILSSSEWTGMKWAGARNNNPWNIKDTTFGNVVGKDEKWFAQFATPEDWFDALVEKIKFNQNNTNSKYYWKTILEYFKLYAPSTDGNNPTNYANSVANNLWVNVNTKISQLDPVKFAAQIAKHDSWYDYSTYGKSTSTWNFNPNFETYYKNYWNGKEPSSTDYKAMKLTPEQFTAQAQARKQSKWTTYETTEQQKEITALRKEFNNLQQVKDYKTVKNMFQTVESSARLWTAAGDLSLIFAYMKILDPNSTVREWEFANAQNAGWIEDKVRNAYNKAMKWTRLSDRQRSDFANTAKTLYKWYEQTYNDVLEEYKTYPVLWGDVSRIWGESMTNNIPTIIEQDYFTPYKSVTNTQYSSPMSNYTKFIINWK